MTSIGCCDIDCFHTFGSLQKYALGKIIGFMLVHDKYDESVYFIPMVFHQNVWDWEHGMYSQK